MEENAQFKNARLALKWIIRVLEKHQIPYQIAGGLAARGYGVQRPLEDIDIDIPEKCFDLILSDIKPYITFGPSHYKSELWDLYLLTLNYKNQPIDISGAHTTKIFNQKDGKWQKIKTDFAKTEIRPIFDIEVPLIQRAELIRYKSVLNRKVDQIDVQQLQKLAAPITHFKKLSKKQKADLFDALYFMNMQELRELSEYYQLPTKAKKGLLIDRIKHFLQTGKMLNSQKIPQKSFAEKGTIYPLKPDTLILKGAYKNDLKTRKFFQKLIGEHFHFTAFGQDWISERWFQGKPPTYSEFAKYWQKENKQRQKQEAKPKQEWAYLSFIQRFLKECPTATKKQITTAWKKMRAAKIAEVKSTLKI